MPAASSDPVAAQQVADHTAGVLQKIRGASQIAEVDDAVRGYRQFARARGVAPQIVDHVLEAAAETRALIKRQATVAGGA